MVFTWYSHSIHMIFRWCSHAICIIFIPVSQVKFLFPAMVFWQYNCPHYLFRIDERCDCCHLFPCLAPNPGSPCCLNGEIAVWTSIRLLRMMAKWQSGTRLIAFWVLSQCLFSPSLSLPLSSAAAEKREMDGPRTLIQHLTGRSPSALRHFLFLWWHWYEKVHLLNISQRSSRSDYD